MAQERKVKMWIVKREVLATSVTDALRKGGRVYEVTEAEPKYQPLETPAIGFKPNGEK